MPKLAIIMRGGLVLKVVSDTPDALGAVEALVIEYDTEGADKENVYFVPEADGTLVKAAVYREGIELTDVDLDGIVPVIPETRRSLWWSAENQAEADEWVADLTAKGCIIEKVDPQQGRPQVDVIFSLDPTKAKEILGYEPEEEEWLIPDYPR